MKIALDLGADVPACIHSRPLYVMGIGESFVGRRVPKSYGVLLVNPMASLSTPTIFQAFSEQGGGRFDSRRGEARPWPSEDKAFIQFLQTDTRNALQTPAEVVLPQISEVLSVLRGTENCLHVAMSGSGATCFALFDTEEQAATAAVDITQKYPNWWTKTDSLVEE